MHRRRRRALPHRPDTASRRNALSSLAMLGRTAVSTACSTAAFYETRTVTGPDSNGDSNGTNQGSTLAIERALRSRLDRRQRTPCADLVNRWSGFESPASSYFTLPERCLTSLSHCTAMD
jgi:hypothetical protein